MTYLNFVTSKKDVQDDFPSITIGSIILPIYKGISYSVSSRYNIQFVPAGDEYCKVIKKIPITLSVSISRFATDNAVNQLAGMTDPSNPVEIEDGYGGYTFQGFVKSLSDTNVTFKEVEV